VTETQEIKIVGPDGYVLAATTFSPPPATVNRLAISVVVNSATGAPRGYYARFARYLAERGIFVITYDYRGMFDSQRMPLSDDPTKMHDWGEKDVASVLDWLSKTHPHHKIIAVGHSIGGTMLGLAPNNLLVSGAINVATPSAYWRLWSGWRRYERLADWYLLLPLVIACLGYVPAAFAGGALPKGVALEWAHWGKHADFVVDEQGKPMHDGFLRFDKPFIFYSFTDDHFAPPTAVEAMKQLYANASIVHKIITPPDWGMAAIGHFGFFRKTAPAAVWDEVVNWIRACDDRL
jgi:predicted alpha/beta hydrolase